MKRRIRRAVQAEFPIRAVIVGVLAMLLIAVVAAATTWIVGERLRTITSSQLAVLTASARLQHQSDVADLSVEAAIATGNTAYAQRYAEIQPQLRATLRRLSEAIHLTESRAAFASVEAAEQEISKLQFAALDLAVSGRREEALQIVADARYRALARSYRRGLSSIQNRSNAFIAATRAETNRYLAVNLATSLAALLLLGVAWIVVVRPARQWANQLADARRRAENATRAKTDFLAVMSHEIRTPLNSIIGFADLLDEDRGLTPEQHRQVRLIQNAGTMLLTVVNDLLDFSKIEAGRIELTLEPFALETLVDNSISIVRGAAEAKGLEVEVSIDRWLPPYLLGDENRLRQVLLNLLNNAVKFTSEGKVSLAVAAAGQDGDQQKVRFTVTDTGPGIAAELQPRLFRPFVQADAWITRRYGGTGLGLSISKRLIELMGGRIELRSIAGEGSSFWFEVSLARAAAPPELALPTAAPSRSDGARILLAEDLPMNQELAKSMLARAGYQVEVAGDGEAAVHAAGTKTFDLVLMDIQMPRMDGISATRRIRALPGTKGQVPILAMTANVLPEQVREFLAAGMNGHIAKPVRQTQLHAAVASALQARGDDRSALAADTAQEVFAPLIFADVQTMLPADRLRGHVETLIGAAARVADAADRLDPECADADRHPERYGEVAADAHKIVSQAGMLGLTRLSDAARALDQAVRQRALIVPARTAFRAAAGDPETFLCPLLAQAEGL
ncbi:response regulator [Sphingomonas parva]|uniref:Sensory/regulatory protein RpfC n=1 Tax=Sphingomonas parva TaxID=2555898 RepID=A0A4Y8ZXN8_9SPHN|nr:ATP-binding protein [Sphingomonas parva]TFI59256.1 response regulator [Sphingomonas parva]